MLIRFGEKCNSCDVLQKIIKMGSTSLHDGCRLSILQRGSISCRQLFKLFKEFSKVPVNKEISFHPVNSVYAFIIINLHFLLRATYAKKITSLSFLIKFF